MPKRQPHEKSYLAVIIPLLIGFFIPLLFKGGISTINHLFFFCSVGAAGLIYLYLLTKHRATERIFPLTENVFFLLAIIFFCASYLQSSTKNVGLLELGAFVSGYILVFVGYEFAKHKRFISTLVTALNWSLGATLIVGFYFYFSEPFERFAGTFNNYSEPWSAFPNAYGDFVLMVLPLTWFLIEDTKKKSYALRKYLPQILFMLGVAALTLTKSEGIYIVGTVLTVCLLSRAFFAQKEWSKLLILTTLGIVIAIGSNYLVELNDFDYREDIIVENEQIMESEAFERKSSFDKRIEHFSTGVELIKINPLLGLGPGSYPYISSATGNLSMLNMANHPHNLFLKMGAENGLICTIAFALFLTITLYQRIRVTLRKLDPVKELFFLAILGFLAHQLIDYHLEFTTITFLFFIYLGIISVDHTTKKKIPHLIPQLRYVNRYIVGAFSVLLIVFSVHSAYFHLQAKLADNPEEMFAARSRSLLISNYHAEHANYLLSNGAYIDEIIPFTNDGLALNLYDPELYYLGGAHQTANLLGHHNLKYLYWNYANADEELALQLQPEIEARLNEYLPLLRTNTHFTVLTENPEYALLLADAIGQDELYHQLDTAYANERNKFEKIYDIIID